MSKKKNAAGHMSPSPCDGCQWQYEGEAGNWCYMFQDAPENLPCTQHDKFEGERRTMGALIRKCPAIIPMMIMLSAEA